MLVKVLVMLVLVVCWCGVSVGDAGGCSVGADGCGVASTGGMIVYSR